tara:strand:- start:238 stop:441 length:204 start_codon:yes stop_codon:yes gene_type:complete
MTATKHLKIQIEMDFEEHLDNGLTEQQAVGIIARDWEMSHEEVRNIINAIKSELNDIDRTNDLGDII